jgi:hypothetical protein
VKPSPAAFNRLRLLPVAIISVAVTASFGSCSQPGSGSLRDVARCLDRLGAWDVVVESSPQRFVFASFTPRQARLRARITYGIAIAPGAGGADETRLPRSLEAVTEGNYPAHILRLSSERFLAAASGPLTSPSAFAQHGEASALARHANLAARRCTGGP